MWCLTVFSVLYCFDVGKSIWDSKHKNVGAFWWKFFDDYSSFSFFPFLDTKPECFFAQFVFSFNLWVGNHFKTTFFFFISVRWPLNKTVKLLQNKNRLFYWLHLLPLVRLQVLLSCITCALQICFSDTAEVAVTCLLPDTQHPASARC